MKYLTRAEALDIGKVREVTCGCGDSDKVWVSDDGGIAIGNSPDADGSGKYRLYCTLKEYLKNRQEAIKNVAKANEMHARQNLAGMIEHAKMAIQHDPMFPSGYDMMGMAHHEFWLRQGGSQMLRMAVTAFKRAAALGSESARAVLTGHFGIGTDKLDPLDEEVLESWMRIP